MKTPKGSEIHIRHLLKLSDVEANCKATSLVQLSSFMPITPVNLLDGQNLSCPLPNQVIIFRRMVGTG